MLRAIDKFADLGFVREHLKDHYSHTGRPSIDPELMIRMLLVGYCFGIRSERRLCEEVHLNLAYRWFCCLGLDAPVPDHSTFSKNRHGRFRDSHLLRELFETTVHRCIEEGLVGGENFAVDASIIAANANRGKGETGNPNLPSAVMHRRAVQESRADFTYDEANDRYICPAGKDLKRYRMAGRRAKAAGNVPKDGPYRYRALKADCDACELKSKCCPNQPMRKVPRSIYESSRDVARYLRGTPDYEFMRHERKKVEMSFAHLKAILKLDRLRLRGPCGANDEFLLAATAQNLRKMAKLYMNGRKMSTA